MKLISLVILDLGFYSSFMVSDKVEIFTKSYKEGSKAVRWECDGSPEYCLEETEKADRGTNIVLHFNEESEEFLDAYQDPLDPGQILPIPSCTHLFRRRTDQ